MYQIHTVFLRKIFVLEIRVLMILRQKGTIDYISIKRPSYMGQHETRPPIRTVSNKKKHCYNVTEFRGKKYHNCIYKANLR